MRVPVTFYEEVKKGAKEAGVSIPDYLIGKVVVDKSTPIPKEGAK